MLGLCAVSALQQRDSSTHVQLCRCRGMLHSGRILRAGNNMQGHLVDLHAKALSSQCIVSCVKSCVKLACHSMMFSCSAGLLHQT